MEPSRIQAVDHVHLESSYGLENSLRWFYGEVGLLEEVDYPLPDEEGLCFKSAHIELRIRLVERPDISSSQCRVTLATASLDEIETQLIDGQVEYELMTGMMGCDQRIGTYDPAGNRVEFKQEWPIFTI